MNIKISNKELQTELIGSKRIFPKYVSHLLNLANRFAQATRPKIVGQMTELVKPFKSYQKWREWYLKNHLKEIEIATEKILKMLEKFKETIGSVIANKIIIRN